VSRSTPPAANEFEVSIIGPGRGECVILHLGDNQWGIVDSCIPRSFSDAAAVEYLNGFQNNALAGVKLIVATHWHDDHIRGLASILRKVPNASFFCSAAVNTDNFFALTGTATTAIQGNSGVEEFAAILGLIAGSGPAGHAKRLASPKWVIENRNLVQLPQRGRSFPVSITALSPSDGTMKLALDEIAKLIPKTGETQRRVTSRSPNHTSIVLWIEAGPLRALLGADLEHTGNAGEGWMAVLQCHQSRQEQRSASFFKVPHHGSANADYPDVWKHMLAKNPVAVVTPYNGGATRLPRPADLARLSGRTSSLYCTAAGAGRVPSRDSVVEKTMRLQLTERRVIEGQAGHVRVRWSLNGEGPSPIVETFYGAYQV
jgi:hypothetical protein